MRDAFDELRQRIIDSGAESLIIYSTTWPSIIGHQLISDPNPKWTLVDADFHDLAYTVYDYCDDIANDINIKHPFLSKCKLSYWFGKTPHDHWANKYKIDISD